MELAKVQSKKGKKFLCSRVKDYKQATGYEPSGGGKKCRGCFLGGCGSTGGGGGPEAEPQTKLELGGSVGHYPILRNEHH